MHILVSPRTQTTPVFVVVCKASTLKGSSLAIRNTRLIIFNNLGGNDLHKGGWGGGGVAVSAPDPDSHSC